MENLELRIQKLEKKYQTLKYSVLFLACVAACAGLNGKVTLGSSALAQQQDKAASPKDGKKTDQQLREEAGIPLVVEAEAFILKDNAGNTRGIWTTDAVTTSFAMMHKGKAPIIAMAVDAKNASMSLTDVYAGKISIGLNDSIRSVAIMDDTKKNSIYLGLTGSGEAAFDMVSTGNSAFVIDGSTSSIDMSGDTSILALTETVGSTIALKAQASSSMMTFLDEQNKQTAALSTIDGRTQIYMNSPAVLEEKEITTIPDEQLSFASQRKNRRKLEEVDAAKPDADKEQKEATEQQNQPQPAEENKSVNMKEYTPFQDKK